VQQAGSGGDPSCITVAVLGEGLSDCGPPARGANAGVGQVLRGRDKLPYRISEGQGSGASVSPRYQLTSFERSSGWKQTRGVVCRHRLTLQAFPKQSIMRGRTRLGGGTFVYSGSQPRTGVAVDFQLAVKESNSFPPGKRSNHSSQPAISC